jgi:hypothetical protein
MSNLLSAAKDVLRFYNSLTPENLADNSLLTIQTEINDLQRAVDEEEEKQNRIEWTRVNNDINGNPRYVCHYVHFITDKDGYSTDNYENVALPRARKLGGRKFHNKQYGGGIVFQSYNIQETERKIKELMANVILREDKHTN